MNCIVAFDLQSFALMEIDRGCCWTLGSQYPRWVWMGLAINFGISLLSTWCSSFIEKPFTLNQSGKWTKTSFDDFGKKFLLNFTLRLNLSEMPFRIQSSTVFLLGKRIRPTTNRSGWPFVPLNGHSMNPF